MCVVALCVELVVLSAGPQLTLLVESTYSRRETVPEDLTPWGGVNGEP
jgi:hypothetical protein